MKDLIIFMSIVLVSFGSFAKDKTAKVDRSPATAIKKKSGCPDGAGYFSDKEKWSNQIQQVMASAQYCADAVKLAEKCGSATPVLLAITTTEAAQRCESDFASNEQDKKGFTALLSKCDELYQLGNGALAKWNVGQCRLNAAVFYSDLFNSRKDLSE
ncbi:MAG: hypothetical protein H7328_10385 [Bdellovibrio sp.]|nr:hypothetical protein [Bdellovibrio sp.]